MNIEILEKHLLTQVPSASGIEFFEGTCWLIGDDSPYLFKTDLEGRILEKFSLFHSERVKNERIPKTQKPDFEALTKIIYQQKNFLLVVGSGSKKNREKLYLFDLQNFTTQQLPATALYEALKKVSSLNDQQLNIEGICTDQENVFIFQRGNIGKNFVFKYPIQYFLSDILEEKSLHRFVLETIQIPNLEGIAAGISDACFLDNQRILFCATYESTSNTFDDGKVLGSLIGIWNTQTQETQTALVQKTVTLPIKIEAISVFKKINETNYQLFVATDSDGGVSELYILQLQTQ